ncbi:MAG: transcriptional regulator [Gammaproteobacteria bacterium]|jgi:putative transcriptional regulator|nr:transcriptional regulator [Gammaproteobacteria bacterium]MBT5602666.1 transcriptional regulator [Gammaproteobacteria bacterium]
MIKNHPDADLLAEYTAGVMALAPTISVTTHLQFCNSCKSTVKALEELGGEMLEQADAVPVSDDLLEQIFACVEEDETSEDSLLTRPTTIDEVASSIPAYLQKFLPEGKLHWKFLSPSVKVAPISVGETVHELALHKIKVGGKVPEHNHLGKEITVVLKGSFSDEDGVYQRGDFMVREAGEIHQPIAATHEECICLSVLAAPFKLTGLKRWLNPFLSFSPS